MRRKVTRPARREWAAPRCRPDLNRQRTDFIAAVHRLKQGFAFQQGANHPDGKAVAGADGIDDVIDFNGIDRSCSPLALLNQAPSQPVLMTTALTPRER